MSRTMSTDALVSSGSVMSEMPPSMLLTSLFVLAMNLLTAPLSLLSSVTLCFMRVNLVLLDVVVTAVLTITGM